MIKAMSQKRVLLIYGPSPDMEFTLTSGREDDGYNVSTVVEVVDIFQATTEYMLQPVQVSFCTGILGLVDLSIQIWLLRNFITI